MNIGSYFQIEGVLLAGAIGIYLHTSNGAWWDLGALKDVGHLLDRQVAAEGIRTGAESLAVNWIEAIQPADPRLR